MAERNDDQNLLPTEYVEALVEVNRDLPPNYEEVLVIARGWERRGLLENVPTTASRRKWLFWKTESPAPDSQAALAPTPTTTDTEVLRQYFSAKLHTLDTQLAGPESPLTKRESELNEAEHRLRAWLLAHPTTQTQEVEICDDTLASDVSRRLNNLGFPDKIGSTVIRLRKLRVQMWEAANGDARRGWSRDEAEAEITRLRQRLEELGASQDDLTQLDPDNEDQREGRLFIVHQAPQRESTRKLHELVAGKLAEVVRCRQECSEQRAKVTAFIARAQETMLGPLDDLDEAEEVRSMVAAVDDVIALAKDTMADSIRRLQASASDIAMQITAVATGNTVSIAETAKPIALIE